MTSIIGPLSYLTDHLFNSSPTITPNTYPETDDFLDYYLTDSDDDDDYNSHSHFTCPTPSLSKFQLSQFHSLSTISTNSSSCSICFDPHLNTKTLHLPCGHEFHLHCISQWLSQKHSCPICRTKII